MPGSTAGRFRFISAPRLHRERIPRHYDEVCERAATARATKLQILERHIPATAVDDGLKVSGRLMVAGRAPDPFCALEDGPGLLDGGGVNAFWCRIVLEW
jgi:hypothetical protein